MSDKRFASLNSLDHAVTRFIVDGLEACVMRASGPSLINLELAFSSFLQLHGATEFFADEIAAAQQTLLRSKLSQQMQRWSAQGVPCPFAFVYENEKVVVSWRHQSFSDHGGVCWRSDDYANVYGWVGQQLNRDFLLPCLCFLKALGCDPIFVTDGARDEGVDCIGLISHGALKSTVVFVQAKSKSDLVSGDPLLQEYAKYAGLGRTRRYMDYLEALGLGRLQDGSAFVYAVLTNSDFKYAAQQGAAKLGVLLRSRRQIAHVLSERFSSAQLETLKGDVRVPASSNLTFNLASSLDVIEHQDAVRM